MPTVATEPTRTEPTQAPERTIEARGVRWARAILVVAGLGVALLVSQGLARFAGDWVRRGALISVDVGSANSVPRFTDVAAEGAAFFADRDTVEIVVPRDMTAAELLSLYHQVNNAGAWRALEEQLGATDDADVLRQGSRVRIPLTVSRDPR